MKKEIVYNPEKVPAGKLLAWNARPLSFGAVTIIMGYLSIFCTDMLHMPPALVGTLLMVSKIFDGVTDLLAGWLVDNTKTKLGKGRPYEFCIIGVWICTYALFSGSADWSITIKCIWIFVLYTLVWSIFGTMLNAAETPYVIRAFGNPIAITKVSAYGGIIVTFGCMAVSITFPMAVGTLGTSLAGWRQMMAMYAVPLLLIGILRLIFVPEVHVPEHEGQNAKVRFRDILDVLKSNRFIWLLAIVATVPQAIAGMAAGTYYFKVVVGDITLFSVMQMFGIIATLSIAVFPVLMKRFTVMQLIGMFSVVSLVGYIINFFAGSNMPVLVIGFLLSGLAAMPISYMRSPIIMDIAEYNELNGKPRMEGTISAAMNFTTKVGQALGAFLVGVMLDGGGYDGALAVQPDSAVMMIRVLYSFIPATLIVVVIICTIAYRPLEKILNKARKVEEE